MTLTLISLFKVLKEKKNFILTPCKTTYAVDCLSNQQLKFDQNFFMINCIIISTYIYKFNCKESRWWTEIPFLEYKL